MPINSGSKPDKPYPDFPLFAHSSGKWAKKIQGRVRYFGQWGDPDGALAEYLLYSEEKPQRPAAPVDDRLTIEDAFNLFLDSKADSVASGDNSPRTMADYKRTCKHFAEHFGRSTAIESLEPVDFADYKQTRSRTCHLVTVGNEITRIKTILRWLERSRLTDPIDTGPEFRKPSTRAVRRLRREQGKKQYTAPEVQAILDEAGIQFRAMLLLGINCAFQNSDLENISLELVEQAIKTGWVDYPREKTEVDRRCPLWKRTRRSLEIALRRRPDTKAPNAFVRRDGKPFSSRNCDIAKRFRSTREFACINQGGFSWLRKTFATVASASQDQVAVDYIMGHADSSMSAVYRQEVWDQRLLAVTKVVGRWLHE